MIFFCFHRVVRWGRRLTPVLVLVISSFFLSTAFAEEGSPGIYAETSTKQGARFDIIVFPFQAEEHLRAVLCSNNHEVTVNETFVVDSPQGPVGVVTLGIPADIEPGSYTVELTAAGRSRAPIRPPVSLPLLVGPRVFFHEDIALDDNLSRLRTEDSDRIAREAREMQALLSSFPEVSIRVDEPLLEPLQGARRTSLYGDRRRYLYADGTKSESIHTGIDYGVPVGTPVYPGHPGTILYTGDRLLTGKTVVVAYTAGLYGLFYHLNEIQIRPGDEVDCNSVLGLSGATGLATGPHLHWEVRAGTVPVSPDDLLGSPLVDKEAIFSIIRHE